MTLIQSLKLASPISVGLPGQPTKPQSEAAMDAGAFSKLLSSVAIEEESMESAIPADQLVKIESALEALEQLPIEELAPDQQELLSAMIELLTLQIAQQEMKIQGFAPGYVKPETENPVQKGTETVDSATIPQLQQKLVELVDQIAQKVQQLQANSNKEFGVVPIFMGVEKEYIFKEPKKVNETIKILEQALAVLELGPSEEANPAAAKQLGRIGDALQQATGFAAQLESSLPDEVLLTRQPVEPAAVKIQNAPTVRLDPVQPEVPAATIESIKTASAPIRAEASAPTSTVRMENLAEDLTDILKNSMKLTGSGENAQIKVSIFPEHLGHLEIRLSTVDGKMAAQIFTSNLVAKEALDMQVYQLRNSLVQQGITVDRIEISQQGASTSFNQQGEQRFAQQQQERRQTSTKNGYQRVEEETASLVRQPSSAGSMMSVDYTI